MRLQNLKKILCRGHGKGMDIDDWRKEGISTPYFSDDLIEEVRSRNDIVDVIGGEL